MGPVAAYTSTVTTDQRFVGKAYLDVLGRSVGAPELAAFTDTFLPRTERGRKSRRLCSRASSTGPARPSSPFSSAAAEYLPNVPASCASATNREAAGVSRLP
jgi:hypothetical protein